MIVGIVIATLVGYIGRRGRGVAFDLRERGRLRNIGGRGISGARARGLFNSGFSNVIVISGRGSTLTARTRNGSTLRGRVVYVIGIGFPLREGGYLLSGGFLSGYSY